MDLSTSQLANKKTEAYCTSVGSYKQKLNNGRSCKNSWQCISQNCQSGVCKGLSEGEHCSAHYDCDQQLYCAREEVWPYTSECAKLKIAGEQCEETNQCKIGLFCWYSTAAEKETDLKRCLNQYSQDHGKFFGWKSKNYLQPTYDDYKFNGQYCKSGIAFPLNENQAQCTTTNHIEFEGKKLQSPYQCDPTDNEKYCKLFFNTTDYQEGQITK